MMSVHFVPKADVAYNSLCGATGSRSPQLDPVSSCGLSAGSVTKGHSAFFLGFVMKPRLKAMNVMFLLGLAASGMNERLPVFCGERVNGV